MTLKRTGIRFQSFSKWSNKATFKILLSIEIKLHHSRHAKINFVYHREEVDKLNALTQTEDLKQPP